MKRLAGVVVGCVGCLVSAYAANVPVPAGGTAPEYVGIWARRVSSSWNDGGMDAWQASVLSQRVRRADDGYWWYRTRLTGMLPAYAEDDAYWSALEPAGEELDWSGDSVCTYCGVGYMWFEAGVTNLFQVNTYEHNNAWVAVDRAPGGELDRAYAPEELVAVKKGEGRAEGAFVPSASGWHAVRFALGRLYGYRGGRAEDGLLHSTDGGQSWHKLLDPGDGSLLRVNPKTVLGLTALARVGSELRGTVTVAPELAGFRLCLCPGATAELPSLPAPDDSEPVAAGGETRDFSLDLPATARWFRLAAVRAASDDAPAYVCWSAPVALADVPTVAEALPAVSFRRVTETPPGAASIEVSVTNCGGGETCDLAVTLVPDGAGPAVTRTVSGLGLGTAQVTLDGLSPNRHYVARLKPVAGDTAGAESPAFDFTSGDVTGLRVPGLWQAAPTGERTRQLGPAAAFARYTGGDSGAWENPFAPGTVSRWTNGARFVYTGFVWLERGTYAFSYDVDDICRIVLDGQEICHTQDNRRHTWTVPVARSAWHPIELEIADLIGQAGGNAGANSFTFACDTSAPRPFLDPGDGSLFRCAAPDETVRAAEARYVPPADLPCLSARATADGTAGDTLTVAYSVVAPGKGPAAKVRIRRGLKADLSDAETVAEEEVSEPGPRTVTLAAEPGTDYFYEVSLTDAQGVSDVIPVASVRALGPSVPAAGTRAESRGWDATFTGRLDVLGANETTVFLLTGPDGQSLTNTAARVLRQAGPFAFDVTFPCVNETVAYAFCVSNRCAREAWTKTTEVRKLVLEDRTAYYWRPEVAAGDWTDPANWSDKDGAPLDARCRYPDSYLSEVRFDRCAAATSVVVRVDGVRKLRALRSAGPVDVTFRADGAGARLEAKEAWAMGLAASSQVAFDGVFLALESHFRPLDHTVCRFRGAGAGCSVGGGSWLNAPGAALEFADGAQWEQRGGRLEMSGAHNRVVLDNAVCGTGEDLWLVHRNGASDSTVVFAGAAPGLTCANLLCGYAIDNLDDVQARLVFRVPDGGYACTNGVLHARGTGSYHDWPLGAVSAKPIVVSLAEDSPAFRGKACTTTLVEWEKGIDTDTLVLSDPPHPNGTLYFTYGWKDGHTTDRRTPAKRREAPTGIRARFEMGETD